MFKTIVFLETSLSHLEAKIILPNAVYMPSIKKGDVIQAIKNGYEAIVIIDGNFGWTPSVWHKEIMIALDYGIAVFGASSMGAIRAAELDSYGMQGIGTVYSMYKNEIIDGDDEVAIAFSPYNNLQTVPLVNIRITLEQLHFKSKKSVFSSIKKIFYAERTWSKIAEIIPEHTFDLIRLNYIDIKKEDAISLLNYVSTLSSQKKIHPRTRDRQFTIFEKNLLQSVFNPVQFNKIEMKQKGDFNQLVRAKNLIKLLSIPKTRQNLLHYQSLIYLIDKEKYIITEYEFIDQLTLFREEKHLLSGNDFKFWLMKQKLFNSDLEKILTDYIKLNKFFLISYNYNNCLGNY